ncbi:glycerol-3-phosphate acyltransferase [Solibacillus sp. FSL W7-1464]|uniref:glycerol-3-phosphate acyltransferase n=1 Tax=Solibacillus sp. FSL W7-1464 TaxID=2921706 RepID=UPI0030F5556C
MFYLLLSYLFGTILFAVVIGKIKGIDLQYANSGNLGARNAGRTLGKWAFILVAVGDGLKGLIVVVAGRMLELPEQMIALAVIAVVLGHLYPFWNHGKGGKGVATVIGAMVAFSPLLLLVFLAGFLLSLLITKSATLSMTGGFIMYGLVASVYMDAGFIVTIALILVIWKQRHSIVERVKPNVLE